MDTRPLGGELEMMSDAESVVPGAQVETDVQIEDILDMQAGKFNRKGSEASRKMSSKLTKE